MIIFIELKQVFNRTQINLDVLKHVSDQRATVQTKVVQHLSAAKPNLKNGGMIGLFLVVLAVKEQTHKI